MEHKHSNLCPDAIASIGGQTQLMSTASGSCIFRFNQQICREDMVEWMILIEKPFTQTEDKHMEKWIKL